MKQFVCFVAVLSSGSAVIDDGFSRCRLSPATAANARSTVIPVYELVHRSSHRRNKIECGLRALRRSYVLKQSPYTAAIKRSAAVHVKA